MFLVVSTCRIGALRGKVTISIPPVVTWRNFEDSISDLKSSRKGYGGTKYFAVAYGHLYTYNMTACRTDGSEYWHAAVGFDEGSE